MKIPHRIILEITNHCNLDCAFCLRAAWQGSLGKMSQETLDRFIEEISFFSRPPDITFGGYGEPLSHPNLIEYIQACKKTGSYTSLITNGTLLTPAVWASLIRAGLDRLWISFDNNHQDAILASPILDGNVPLIGNLENNLGPSTSWNKRLDLGLAFVLTRTNSQDLLDWIKQGIGLGLKKFFITNLEVYDNRLRSLTPYQLSQFRQPGTWRADLSSFISRLEEIAQHNGVNIEGPLLHPNHRCPFAERGDLVLRWDGEISPCLPLLYDRTIHVGSWKQDQSAFSMGNIHHQTILDTWTGSVSRSLRSRLLEKDFSPCLHCRDCWLADDNLQDCMGYDHPVCGGCLWAEGLIDCP